MILKRYMSVLIINISVSFNTSPIEQWSILSNVINYCKHNKNPVDYYKLDVKGLEPKNHKRMYDKLEKDGRQVMYLDFGDTPEKLS